MSYAEDIRRAEARRKLGLCNTRAMHDRRAYANVGRNHPDYGMTPAEHETAKAVRAAKMKAPPPFLKRMAGKSNG